MKLMPMPRVTSQIKNPQNPVETQYKANPTNPRTLPNTREHFRPKMSPKYPEGTSKSTMAKE
jgi:hypothetical protein